MGEVPSYAVKFLVPAKLRLRFTDIPGLHDAVLLDRDGQVCATYRDLTMGQVEDICRRRGVDLEPA